MKVKKKLVFYIGISFLFVGCSLLPEEQEYKIAPIVREKEVREEKVAMVQYGDLEESTSFRVAYEAKEGEDLSFAVSGEEYGRVYVEEGEEVKSGQLLAELDVSDFQVRISDLKRNIERNRILCSHLEETFRLKEIEQEAYEAQIAVYENEIKADSQEVNEINIKVRERQIYAGIDGVVTYVCPYLDEFYYFLGVSQEGICFISLVSTERSLKGISKTTEGLSEGMEVFIETATGGHEAKIVLIKELTGNSYEIYLELLDTIDMGEGINGKVDCVTKTAKNVLYIPISAVLEVEDKYYVDLRNEEGFRESREVILGDVLGRNVIVKGGLEEGEVILCE